MVRPPDGPSPSAGTTLRTPRRAPGAPPPAEAHRPHRASRPMRPRSRPRPHIVLPPALSGAFPRDAEVCALGRRYGRWQPDSPEADICRSTYGR